MQTIAWVLQGQNGPNSFTRVDRTLSELGEHDVLIKLNAASLNHRDVAIAEGLHSLSLSSPVIPLSDGAGTVYTTGSKVSSFRPGDKVCTHLVPNKPPSEPSTMPDIMEGLGHGCDGTLCTYAIFHESALVKMPDNLTFVEASTLTCAGLTAWNALFGLRGVKGIKEGDYVLVQGTGGVSIFALQFALAVGATVIATTSSEAKAQRLRQLGAHHVLNYRTDLNWGTTAKKLTSDGKGMHVIVDVGGLATLKQSLQAIRPEGVISVTGLLGESTDIGHLTLLECLTHSCTARGVILGTRDQFMEMNQFVQEKGIKPIIDEKVFQFEEARNAYRYMMASKHFSKICITME